jgi:hypothetical protein
MTKKTMADSSMTLYTDHLYVDQISAKISDSLFTVATNLLGIWQNAAEDYTYSPENYVRLLVESQNVLDAAARGPSAGDGERVGASWKRLSPFSPAELKEKSITIIRGLNDETASQYHDAKHGKAIHGRLTLDLANLIVRGSGISPDRSPTPVWLHAKERAKQISDMWFEDHLGKCEKCRAADPWEQLTKAINEK